MSKKKTDGMKPGKKATRSGQYGEFDQHGKKIREVTVPKGHKMPPAVQPGDTYTLVDPTDNKSGKGK